MCFFLSSTRFSLPAAGLFSRSRLRGTQGGRLYTTARVWVPAGLRDPRSGRPKSRDLASNHGIAFRRARASQDNGTPLQFSVFARLLLHHVCITPSLERSTSLLCGSHGYISSRAASSSFCDGHGRFVRVCVCHVSCPILSNWEIGTN